MKALIVIGLFAITIIALYCAAGGWINAELNAALKENKSSRISEPVISHGIQFVNDDALRRYEIATSAKEWFPWMVNLPQPLALLLTALSFGIVGGVTRVAFDAVRNNVALVGEDFWRCLLGWINGAIGLGNFLRYSCRVDYFRGNGQARGPVVRLSNRRRIL